MKKASLNRPSAKRIRPPSKARKEPASQPKSTRAKVHAAGITTARGARVHLSKQESVLSLLRQAEGVSLDNLVTETGWQKHSLRGFLAGTVRGKLGLNLISEKINGIRTYRIAPTKSARPKKPAAGKARKAS